MAPEILSNQSYTNKADLWSVGVTFYQLLFGDYPFNGMSEQELRSNIARSNGNNLPIPRHKNNISYECEDLLKKILTANPQQRLNWRDFFNHKIFSDEYQRKWQQANVHTIFALKNPRRMQVSTMWNTVKNNVQGERAINLNDFLGLAPKMAAIKEEQYQESPKQQHYEQNQPMVMQASNECSLVYQHELNKIRFIFQAMLKLKHISKMTQNMPLERTFLLAAACLGKKAMLFLNFNLMSISGKTNSFGLPNFTQWLNSPEYK